MKLANRIHRIQPSATLAMTAKAAELRAQGMEVFNMSVGEPDFITPDNIINAAVQNFQIFKKFSEFSEFWRVNCCEFFTLLWIFVNFQNKLGGETQSFSSKTGF